MSRLKRLWSNAETMDKVRTFAAIVAAIALGVIAAGFWDRLDNNEEDIVKAICAERVFLEPRAAQSDSKELKKLVANLKKSGVHCKEIDR